MGILVFCSLDSRDHMKSSTMSSFEKSTVVSWFTSFSGIVYAPELQVNVISFVWGLRCAFRGSAT